MFGCGYNWTSQTATEEQFYIYFGEEIKGFRYRIMGECWMYLFFLTGFIGTWVINKKYSFGLFYGSILMSSGSFIRFMGQNNYWLCLLGNSIMSISQAFAYPSPSTLSARFFDSNQEALILSLPIFFCSVGVAFGLWFPCWIMNNAVDPQIVESKMRIITMFGMIITIPALVLTLFFMSDYPKIPPKKDDSRILNNLEEIEREEERDEQIKFEKEQQNDNCPSENKKFLFDGISQRSFTSEEKDELNKHYILGWVNSNKVQFLNKNCLLFFFMSSGSIGTWWAFVTLSCTSLDSIGFTQLDTGYIC